MGTTTQTNNRMMRRGFNSSTSAKSAGSIRSGACVEGLEGRRLLAAAVWNSTVDNASWEVGSNWLSGTVPAAGDDVTFPDLGLSSATILNVQSSHAHDVGDVTFAGARWNVFVDAGLTIHGDVDVASPAVQISGATLADDTTFNVPAGDLLALIGTFTGNGHALTITGEGMVEFVNDTDVSTLILKGSSTSVRGGPAITRVEAGGTLFGNSRVASLVGNGGTLRTDDGYRQSVLLATGGVSLAAGTTFAIGSSDPMVLMRLFGNGQLKVTGGTVDLGGATLAIRQVQSYVPPIGEVLPIVANDTGTATVGQFAGLPEGATVHSTDGIAYQIHYNVGTSGHDVTLTAVEAPTVQSSNAPTRTTSRRPALDVAGHDPRSGASDAALTYTWSTTAAPIGARSPKFNDNATISAGHVVPRCFAAGTYTFECTITNPAGVTVVESVTTSIRSRARGLRLTPHAAQLRAGETQAYGGRAIDQFGKAMKTRSIAYALLEGNGTIDASGLFAASGKGHARIEIAINGLEGVVGATVTA